MKDSNEMLAARRGIVKLAARISFARGSTEIQPAPLLPRFWAVFLGRFVSAALGAKISGESFMLARKIESLM